MPFAPIPSATCQLPVYPSTKDMRGWRSFKSCDWSLRTGGRERPGAGPAKRTFGPTAYRLP
jgi:hypothetical protein